MSTDPAPVETGQATPEPGAAPEPQATPEPPAPWYGDLAPDQKGYVENKGWKGVEDVLTSYRNLEKLHGVPADKLLRLPDDPAKMGEVWDKLGRPEAPDKYTMALPEEMKDSVYERMSAKAHEAGLSDAQFQALQVEFKDVAEALQTERGEKVAADLESWKSSHAADFQNVQNLMRKAGITQDEVQKAMNGDSAAWYGALAKVASRMGEGSMIEGDGGQQFTISPEAAQQKVDQMMGDKAFTDRLYSEDKKVREAAAAERRPYMEIIANAKSGGGDGEAERLRAENARLQAELRRRA